MCRNLWVALREFSGFIFCDTVKTGRECYMFWIETRSRTMKVPVPELKVMYLHKYNVVTNV